MCGLMLCRWGTVLFLQKSVTVNKGWNFKTLLGVLHLYFVQFITHDWLRSGWHAFFLIALFSSLLEGFLGLVGKVLSIPPPRIVLLTITHFLVSECIALTDWWVLPLGNRWAFPSWKLLGQRPLGPRDCSLYYTYCSLLIPKLISTISKHVPNCQHSSCLFECHLVWGIHTMQAQKGSICSWDAQMCPFAVLFIYVCCHNGPFLFQSFCYWCFQLICFVLWDFYFI